METYLLMIYVTIQQENAIKNLFQQNGWPYVTTDVCQASPQKRKVQGKNQSQTNQKGFPSSFLLKSGNVALSVSEASYTCSNNSNSLCIREKSTGKFIRSVMEETDASPMKQVRLSQPLSEESTTQFVKEDMDIPFASECQVIAMEAEDEAIEYVENADHHSEDLSKELQEAVNTLYTNSTSRVSAGMSGNSGEYLGESMTDACNKVPVLKNSSTVEKSTGTVMSGPEHILSGIKLNAEFIGTKLPLPGKFMALEELFDIVKSDVTPLKHIPPGPKSNVYFVTDNSRNAERRLMNIRQIFHDDCGIWDSSKGSTHRQIVVKETAERVRYVVEKNGQYCVQKAVNNHSTWQPVEPQPREDQIIIVRRCYSKLKGNINYKRRVTSFESLPGFDKSKQTLAIYEYVGEYKPPMIPHGNCKVRRFRRAEKDGNPYKRIHPDLLEIAGLQAKTHRASQVERQLRNMDLDFSETPTKKQIRNKKYNESKKERLAH